jgi:hypothetical protein
MLQLGKNITAAKDPLMQIEVMKVFEILHDRKGQVHEMVEQLRSLYSIDPAKYRQHKTKLPYITCGRFNPPFRRTENFAALNHFIIDIDHLEVNGLGLQLLKEKFAADDRVKLLFTSPGGNGLKVMFELTEKCTDAGKYSLFYKKFAHELALEYNLLNSIDSRTSDVARACFLSFDADAYLNTDAVKIDLEAAIQFDSPAKLSEINKEIKLFESQLPIIVKEDRGPDLDQLIEIRKKLNPKYKTKSEKLIYVPEKLDQIIDSLKTEIENIGLLVSEIKNINYGKQIMCELQNRKAEINLFYGKRGFSVVKSAKSGTDKDLTEILHQVVCQYLFP